MASTVSWPDIALRLEQRRRKLPCAVIWHGRIVEFETPELVRNLAQQPGVRKVHWKM
jgi:hypothetical protein